MVLRLGFAVLLSLGLQEPEAPPPESSPHTQDGRAIKEPRKKKTVPPEWPPKALRAGLNGHVVLEC
ncbi:MAG TPA: hypothetical protein VI669_11970, partial [Vicinamibacteria bacterium]